MKKLGPISPKAHGAWLGAGTGATICSEVIQLLQQYVTHGPLPGVDVSLIYLFVPPVLAFIGAYLLPAIPASLLEQAREAERLHVLPFPPLAEKIKAATAAAAATLTQAGISSEDAKKITGAP